jgi:RNA-directed DNA polymerase
LRWGGRETVAMTISYERLCSWDNIWQAWRRASKGKRGRYAAASFEYRLEDNLWNLRSELIDRSYHPGPYSCFHIHEPKRRLISAAPFRDRVVHHALCRIIEPVFERSFIADSYANRVGKGTHRALARARHFARKHRYVLQCDIEQFFPAIDHAILRGILAVKIQDRDIMWLADRIMGSGEGVLSGEYDLKYFPGDDLFSWLRPRGLPIGNLTSQFWANCYLNPFDHFVKRDLRCEAYVRYVDDMLLFHDDKCVLRKWRRALIRRLQRLRLTLHERSAHVRPVSDGIPFLGFSVFPTHCRLKRRKGIAYRRHLKKLIAAYQAGDITFDNVDASIQGWVNHVRYGDTFGLRKSVLGSMAIKRAD